MNPSHTEVKSVSQHHTAISGGATIQTQTLGSYPFCYTAKAQEAGGNQNANTLLPWHGTMPMQRKGYLVLTGSEGLLLAKAASERTPFCSQVSEVQPGSHLHTASH